MPKRIYNGPHPEVDVVLPDGGNLKAKRGVAVDVDVELAKRLDEQGDAWLTEKPRAAVSHSEEKQS